MVADIILIRIEGMLQRRAHRDYFDNRRYRNNPVPHGIQLCLLRPYLVGSGEAIRPGGFTIPLAAFPPFEVVATFGVDFVLPRDRHVIAPNPTLAVEKRRNETPGCTSRSGNLDFLEKFDAGDFRH